MTPSALRSGHVPDHRPMRRLSLLESRRATLDTRSEDEYAELLRRDCPSRARRRQSAASPREKAMKLSRGVARFNKRVTNRIQGVYAWLVPRGPSSSTAVDVRVASTERRSSRSGEAALSSSRSSTARNRIGCGTCATGVARDPCGAHLHRSAARNHRDERCGVAARAPVAPGARVLPARGEARDSRARRASARLWAPRPRQRDPSEVRVPQPRTACAGGARRVASRTATT